MAPPAIAATWRCLVDVDLGNGTVDEPADHVQALDHWRMPGLFEGVSESQLTKLQTEMGDREFAVAPQAGDWLGHLVAKVLKIDVSKTGSRKRIQDILAIWERNGAIVRAERFNPTSKREQQVYRCGSRT